MVSFFGCSDDDDDSSEDGNWVRLSDYDGDGRTGAVGFTIDGEAYIGLGSDGDSYLLDFYKYNSDLNFWDEIASFPGSGRISAVAFDLNGKGYVGTGYNEDLDVEELADFWEYDPGTDTWSQIADFPGEARYSAVAFSVGGKGYVGTGFNGSYEKDFFSYNSSTGEWSEVQSGFGAKRESAFAFVIDDIAYVGSGSSNGLFLYDFWAFDAATETWGELSKNSDDDDYDEYLLAMERSDAAAFVMDGLAYITTGADPSYLTSVVSYDPINNLWEDDYTDFEGSARIGAVAFVLDDLGYLVTGASTSRRLDDIWAFYPEEEYEEFD